MDTGTRGAPHSIVGTDAEDARTNTASCLADYPARQLVPRSVGLSRSIAWMLAGVSSDQKLHLNADRVPRRHDCLLFLRAKKRCRIVGRQVCEILERRVGSQSRIEESFIPDQPSLLPGVAAKRDRQ